MSINSDHFGVYCVCSPDYEPPLPQLPITEDLADTAQALTTITWLWDVIPDATNYVLQVSASAGFGTILATYSGPLLTYTATGLTSGTTYYARVKGQAAGYTDSAWVTDSAITDAAPTTELAYWGWSDVDVLPNEASIISTSHDSGSFPYGGTITADFTANAVPKFLWMAERSTEPTKTEWYGSALNNGNIGAIETFAIKGVSSSGSGASWRVYMSTFATQQTDTPIEFRVV